MPSGDAEIRAAQQKIAYYRGLEAYRTGDIRTARTCLAEAQSINVSPKYTALSTFWQGEIAFREGDYAVAAAKYNAYLKRAPRTEREYALAWYNLGYCAFDRNDWVQAGDSFRRFLAAHAPKDRYRADALNRLGDVAYSDRRFEEAVGEYDRVIALATPEAEYARYKRAVTLGILGRTEQKQQALRQIETAGGEYADEASYELGRSYIAQQKYAEGAAQLERFVARYPSSPRVTAAWSDLGLAYLNLGNRQKSLACYDRVVNAAPQSSEARGAMQSIREIYVSEGDADAYFDYAARAGIESDLTALSRDSLSFAAAQKLYLDGDRAAATRALNSYVETYPKGSYRTDALYYLSDCYLVADNRERAIETLTALANQGKTPYTVPVLEKLSELTCAEKRWDEAAAAYRRLYDVAPSRTAREDAATGYVRARVAGGDAAKIAAAAREVIALPDAGQTATREAKYALATQLREGGDAAEAAKLYRDLAAEVRTKEGSEAAYRLIEATFASGDLDRTEKEVFALSDRNPQPYWLARAYLLLGEVYVRRGDTFQARATWQSVADGYSPADDGIVEEARARIAKLN